MGPYPAPGPLTLAGRCQVGSTHPNDIDYGSPAIETLCGVTLTLLRGCKEALLATTDLENFKHTFDEHQRTRHDADRLLGFAALEVQAMGPGYAGEVRRAILEQRLPEDDCL